jgi:signal transduction histidine kinase
MPTMLKRLRLHLTGLYILAALGLVALVGAGAYTLLGYYFQSETDLALSSKMAQAFRQFGLTPPQEVLEDELQWRQGELPDPTSAVIQVIPSQQPASDEEHEDEGEDRNEARERDHSEREEHFTQQLASLSVHLVGPGGQEITLPGGIPPVYALDRASIKGAVASGRDRRTVRIDTGERLRVLTYRVDSSDGTFFIQVGRSLVEQDRVRRSFMFGLFGLGLVAALIVGLGSWGLSGQSLAPAQRSWDQQQTFVANASHELRTPLTLIRASADVIVRSDPPPDERSALMKDVLSECDYMDRLIDDLLLLSRLDSRRLQLANQPVPLAGLLAEVSRRAETLAGQSGVCIRLGSAMGTVRGDPERLRQVLLILIDNAIRHTPPGGEIRLETHPGRKTWQVSVTDTGAGIPAEHLKHMFERFYQANPTGEGAARTNGLGLSIARGIIEAQRGRIALTSQVGRGTRAVIELPSAD